MVVIRNARSFEAGRLAEIGLAAWEGAVAAWGEDVAALRPNAKEAYERFAREQWPLILVGEVEGEIAGWGAREDADNHVSDLWIDPRFQGQGVGSKLLSTFESEIAEAGHETAEIETHARNLRAVGLFERRGYAVHSLSIKYAPSLDRDIETIGLSKVLKTMADSIETELFRALDLLAADGYRTGGGWRQAHEIAQAHEGEVIFDRLHALCHRIEGDTGNAGYWYRRAGAAPSAGSFEEEAQALRSTTT